MSAGRPHVPPQAIENVVAAVGHEAGTQHRDCPDGAQSFGSGLPSERDHLDRNRTVRGSEAVDHFTFVRNDDQPRGGAATIFSRSSAPPRPLIEVKRAEFDFICAVDREVDTGMFRECGERNSEVARQGGGALRSRNADDSGARRPMAFTASAAVDPLPSPTTIPSWTSRAAASAAASFASTISV